MTLWQAAPWLGVLSDTDMCDKDVVIMQRMTMTNIPTASKGSLLWLLWLERSHLGGVLEKREASWAIAQFLSRAS